MILFEEESAELKEICELVKKTAYAKVVFLIDRDGQILYAPEKQGIDTDAMGSLVSGMVATAIGLLKLFNETEPAWHYIQGDQQCFYCEVMAKSLILIVVFDDRSTLGLVKSSVKKIDQKFINLLEKMKNSSQNKKTMVFSEISDEDIDDLFGNKD
jgi:predicted regulator of Ras-like GTPase activity (Roadblock/LC7/MglB family)